MRPFRILSLDGGGVMGAFTASVLKTYEDLLPEKDFNKRRTAAGEPPLGLADHFDLITGTSTGGIIAIGLAMGATAAEILEFYETAGPKIFRRSRGLLGWTKPASRLFRPKFGPEELRAAVEKVAKDKTLAKAGRNLVIPSYDCNAGRVYLFKTPHHEHCMGDASVKAVDAALATSAAPTYFPAHHVPGKGPFIDGGVWANCPAMVGIAEAVSYLDVDIKSIRLLSVGTTTYPFRIGVTERFGGGLNWAPKIIETFMFSQVQGTLNAARCLLRDRAGNDFEDRLHRIDFIATRKHFKMDDAALVKELREIGAGEAHNLQNFGPVMRDFLNGDPAPPLAPVS